MLLGSLCVALLLQSGSCFVPASSPRGAKVASAVGMSQSDDQERQFAASALTAAFILSNVFSVLPAFAAPSLDEVAGSSQFVAAKSGGRVGGRSASGSRGASPSYSKSSTTVQRTTIIQQAPVVVAPPVGYGYGGYGGYGYGGVDAGTVGKFWISILDL